jgi:hypothetical protein
LDIPRQQLLGGSSCSLWIWLTPQYYRMHIKFRSVCDFNFACDKLLMRQIGLLAPICTIFKQPETPKLAARFA